MQLFPAAAPPARSFAAMTYDAASQNVVLIGGFGGLFISTIPGYSGTGWADPFSEGGHATGRSAGVGDERRRSGKEFSGGEYFTKLLHF